MPLDRTSSPAIIQATSQQTRFHLLDDTNSKELDLHGVNISIGKQEILSDSHLKLSEGVHYVLVGRNGVGKSTLLRAIGEKIIPGIPSKLRVLYLQQSYDSGENIWDGTSTAVEYVVKSDKAMTKARQTASLLRDALDNHMDPSAAAKVVRMLQYEEKLEELEEAMKMATLRSGARGLKTRKELKALEEEVEAQKARLGKTDDSEIGKVTDEAVNMLADIDSQLEQMSASTAESRAEMLLKGLGFSKTARTQPLSALSGGWRMRTILASILFQPCDLLLLDEPTNFLDMPSLLWLENYLQEIPITIAMVTHDRAFSDAVGEEVIVLRDLKLERFTGNLSAYEVVRAENKQRLTKMKNAQERQKVHMEQTISGNIRAAKASGDDKKLKQAASRQKKIDERMGYQVGIRGGRFKLNRDLPGYHTAMRAEIEIPKDEAESRLTIPKTPSDLRFPGPLVSCENLNFSYIKKGPPQTMITILRNVTLTIHMHDRIALVGLNGAGKSTLVSCLVNQPNPGGRITGNITHHPKARIGYFSQAAMDLLPESGTALEYIANSDGLVDGEEEQQIRRILASVGLAGRTVSEIPLSRLSGGQKVRVALAKILHPPPHLLVLDEVTTHLDADTIMALADELDEFDGAVLVVSHDRWFLKKVVERTQQEEVEEVEKEGVQKVFMMGDGTGAVEELTGGVAEFEERVRKRKRGKNKQGG